MDENQETNTSTNRRIFLRFRTEEAPDDKTIMNEFYSRMNLQPEACFIHWQSREYKHTLIIVDVHNGCQDQELPLDSLPLEVYRIDWKPDKEHLQVPASLQNLSIHMLTLR